MEIRDAELSGDPYIDSLLGYYVWDGNELTFGFPTANQYTGYEPGEETTTNFARFTAVQQTAVRAILANVSTFASLTFTEKTGTQSGASDLRFGSTSLADPAYAYPPQPGDWAGDAWFSNDGTFADPVLGNYAYFGIMHEIGHSLGLGHPHEPDIGNRMPKEHDWMGYSVMSYRSNAHADIGYYNGDWGFAQSYMLDDIAALQYIYGANYDYNSADTVYKWSSSTGELFIDGIAQGAPGSNVIFMTIWDGGGSDTYDFSDYSAGDIGTTTAIIDLRPGEWSTSGKFQFADLGVGKPEGNIANAYLYEGNPQSLIENAIGTKGDDEIWGNDGQNALDGGSGDDTLWGLAGDDILFGRSGDDILFGNDGNDILHGGDGVNYLHGGRGDDVLKGGAGRGSLYGDGGNDTLIATAPASMFGGKGNDKLLGGEFNDYLHGDAGADEMVGGNGDDRYYFDNVKDVVVEKQGQGIDTVVAYISVNAQDNVENVILEGTNNINATGNALDNHIYGNNYNNIIIGGLGADIMEGLSGDDIFYVDNPGDIVRGNLGFDTVYSSISYALSDVGNSSIEILVLSGSEDINGNGNEFENKLVGNSGRNALNGFGRDDTIFGKAKTDTINGGSGNDTLNGDKGNDRIDGNSGRDVISGGIGRDIVTGGNHADRFVFADGDFAGLTFSKADQITDFSSAAGDWIDLSAVDARTGTAGDQAFDFIGDAEFSGAAGELRFRQNATNTLVLGDTDGDGMADFAIALTGLHTLEAGDFVL